MYRMSVLLRGISQQFDFQVALTKILFTKNQEWRENVNADFLK